MLRYYLFLSPNKKKPGCVHMCVYKILYYTAISFRSALAQLRSAAFCKDRPEISEKCFILVQNSLKIAENE